MEFKELGEVDTVECPFCGHPLMNKVVYGSGEDEYAEMDESPCEHVVFMELSHGDGFYHCDDALAEAKHWDWYEDFQEALKPVPDVVWLDRSEYGVACGPVCITWNCLVAKDAGAVTRELITLCETKQREEQQEDDSGDGEGGISVYDL